MTATDMRTFAENLASALARNANDVLIDDGIIKNLAAAESVREAATTLSNQALVGYKIGATNHESQRVLGCDEPFYGPILASRMLMAGSNLSFSQGILGVEAEYAFKLSNDLPARNKSYNRYDLAKAIESCHVALELIGRRTAGEGLPPFFQSVADFGLNWAFVVGEEIIDWQIADLENTQVMVRTNGKLTGFGTGSNVMGHPLNSVAWLANKLSDEGTGLKTGDWISTGSAVGILPVENKTTISAEFKGQGEVKLEIV